MEKQKRKIGVIFGGLSHEKEISLESGRNVIYKLQTSLYYEPVPLFLAKNLHLYQIDDAALVCHATAEIEIVLRDTAIVGWSSLAKLVDFVFIALHGGVGENGVLQGALEMLDIPYNGSGVLTSALCMNKYKLNGFLQTEGFSIPAHMLVASDANESCLESIEKQLPYPLIVKPHDDGCSVLVQKVHNRDELQKAIQSLAHAQKSYALIEEYIQGMELTVGVIGNNDPLVMAPSYCVTTNSILTVEEKFLPGAGENQTPAPLSQSAMVFVKQTIRDIFFAIQASGYIRIDCFYQDALQSPTGVERLVVLEVNTLPALTPATCIFHQALEEGIMPLAFLERIIQLGFEKHAKAIVYSSDSVASNNAALGQEIIVKSI